MGIYRYGENQRMMESTAGRLLSSWRASPGGVTHDGSKFLVPVLTPKVEFTVGGEEVEVIVSEGKVDEKTVVEVNGVYFTAENFAQALSASTSEHPAVLLKDIDLPTAVEITEEVTLELNEHTLTISEDTTLAFHNLDMIISCMVD